MHERLKQSSPVVYQLHLNWFWRRGEGWFCSVQEWGLFFILSLYGAEHNLYFVGSLHWCKIIIPPIQSSREDLEWKVGDSDLWKCQKWAHAMHCFTAPLSYTIMCMYACVLSLLHGYTRLPSQLVPHEERRKDYRLLCTAAAKIPQNRNSKTKLSC